MITSADNPKVKQARALLDRRGRAEQGFCLAEGVRLIEDAVRAGVLPALVFCLPDTRQDGRAARLLQQVAQSGRPVFEVIAGIFQTLSDTVTSQGIVAVMPIPQLDPLATHGPYLVLDQVRDPGNLGTILRSAEAAGVALVLLVKGSADPWSPKVLRAGMGTHFRLPVRAGLGWDEIRRFLGRRAVWLAEAGGETAYDAVDWLAPSALVVGGETTGISVAAAALGGRRLRIPMAGGVESLNAAMAAAIVLFEAARQRRRAGPLP